MGVLPRMPSPSCVKVETHTSQGVQGHNLEDKVGRCVATAIRKELSGTEFEWMLDIEREDPPKRSSRTSSLSTQL